MDARSSHGIHGVLCLYNKKDDEISSAILGLAIILHTMFHVLVTLGKASQLLSVAITMPIAMFAVTSFPNMLDFELLVVMISFRSGENSTEDHHSKSKDCEQVHF